MASVDLGLVSPVGLVLEGAISADVGVEAHDLMSRRSEAVAGEIVVLSAPACKFCRFIPFSTRVCKEPNCL